MSQSNDAEVPTLPVQTSLLDIAGKIEQERTERLWTDAIACARDVALAFLPRKKTNKKAISKTITFGPDCHVTVKYSVPEDCQMPFGADRFVFFGIQHLARAGNDPVVRFEKASQLLEMFGLQKGGSEYRRLWQRFDRLLSLNIEITTNQGDAQKWGMGSRFLEEWRLPTKKGAEKELRGQEVLDLTQSPYFVQLSEGLFKKLTKGGPEQNLLLLRLDLLKHFRDCPIGWDFCVFLSHRCGSARKLSEVPHDVLMQFFKAGKETDGQTMARLQKYFRQIKDATGDALNAEFVCRKLPSKRGAPRKRWALRVGPSRGIIFPAKPKELTA